MKLKGLSVLILIACCVGLPACSLLGPIKTPEIHTYALTWERGQLARNVGAGLVPARKIFRATTRVAPTTLLGRVGIEREVYC